MKILSSSTTIHTRISKALWLCSFLLSFTLTAQEEVSFLFVGDVMQHEGQITAALNPANGRYEYEDGFKFVKPIINQYDLKIANLEVTLAGKPYKGYPQFSAPDELAETLVHSGFNIILTANNHSCDRGAKGVTRTLDKLDELGVLHTGTFRNKEERKKEYPLMIKKNGLNVAILNYTYGTNGLEVAEPLIINYIDTAVIRKDVARAKELKADYIVCNMHWGTEYKFLPNEYQKKYEKFCYDLGVDMVIGGHPHVVQPMERKTVRGEEKLTVWSLGNFVSNMQTRPTRGGLMVGASIQRKDNVVKLKDAEYYLVYVLRKTEGALAQYYVLPDYNYNQYRQGFIDATNVVHYNNFFTDSRELFAQHNIGIEEKTIKQDDQVTTLYNGYLRSYYSVLVSGRKDDILNDKRIMQYVHESVDHEGKCHILSGVCSTKDQALGNLQFVKDAGLSANPVLVLVKPEGIEIIEK